MQQRRERSDLCRRSLPIAYFLLSTRNLLTAPLSSSPFFAVPLFRLAQVVGGPTPAGGSAVAGGLAGGVKAVTTEGKGWENVHFGDREREEKFHKLMVREEGDRSHSAQHRSAG